MARKSPNGESPEADEAIAWLERLTLKQRKFITFYLGEANGNATEAARLAGYAWPEKQGHQQLVKPYIREAIEAEYSLRTASPGEVLGRLTEHARADIGDFDGLIGFDGDGKLTIDLKGARKAGKSRLIKKLKPTPGGISIELHDAQSALALLGRHHGLFGPAPESGTPDHDGSRDVLDSKLSGLAAAADPPPDTGEPDR
jgi:hypothetical protein